jgi:hypothetical protein
MKPTTVIASILGLALAAAARPAVKARWCHPVCCCGSTCIAGQACDEIPLNGITYCCEEDLESVGYGTRSHNNVHEL